MKRNKFTPNEIIDCGDYYEICLYNKQHQKIAKTKIDKIDKENLKKVKEHKWHLHSCGYIATIENKQTLFLHQFILGKRQGFEIDHINHNKTDNRKQNLRHCTRSQNSMNRKVKGYFWNNEKEKWTTRIKVNYKTIHLGHFRSKQDAINARKNAELKHFGKFAFNH